MNKYPSERQERFIVRMPDGLRDRIKVEAEKNNRSMNSEIISTLESAYPEPSDVMHVHLDDIRHALDLYERETDARKRLNLQNLVSDLAVLGHKIQIDWDEEMDEAE